MIKLKYQMFIRENTSQGVRLPEELGEPSGHFRLMPNGGFIVAEPPPRMIRDSIDVYRWMSFCAPVEVLNGYLQLPRPYVRLGLLPKFGESVVLFGATDWLEVWPVDKWLAQMRTTAADLHNLMAAVRDELDARRK